MGGGVPKNPAMYCKLLNRLDDFTMFSFCWRGGL